ncbi:MAG: response regulator [Myxococcales bacterium]
MSPPCSVLIVDDEEDLRAALADLLADEGFAVAQAENGAVALGWLRSHSAPDLVLLDLLMPVMNGLRFRQEQLADPALAAIPTVAITAGRVTGEQAEAMQVMAILYKPLDLVQLLSMLQRCRS